MLDYSERVEFTLTKAEAKKSVSQVEVFLGANKLLTIRSAVGKILESKVIQDAGIGIRILTKDHGMGFSSTCDLSDKAIVKAIEEAISLSRYRKVNPEYSFSSSQKATRVNKFYDKKLVNMILSYDDINEQVNQMLNKTITLDQAIKEAAGSTHLVEFSKQIMNSNDVNISEKGTYWTIELMAVAESSLDRREGTDSSAGYSINEIDTETLSQHASDMAVRSLNGKKVDSDSYEIILSPVSVSTFLDWMSNLMLPQNHERNMPLLSDKIGDQIASALKTVGHDPLRVPTPISGAYDDEGVPTHDKVLIKEGIFKEMPLDTFYATKYQTSSNGMAFRLLGGSGMTLYPGQLYQSEPAPLLPALYMEGGKNSIE
ncbi:MAG: TldD/PmbA family protein, partial [Candidatus Hodarchaeota archaeon]